MNFNEAMLEQLPVLHGYATSLTRRKPGDRDDLVQDTLTRAIAKQHLFTDGSNMQAWLVTIMRNMNINRIRKSATDGGCTMELIEAVLPPALPSQEKTVEFKECAREFARLPKVMQEVINRIAIKGDDYEKTAKILNIPVSTVRSRLSRGRIALRERTGMPPGRTYQKRAAP